MFDTVGSRLSFSVAAGLQETFRVSFWRGAAGFDVSGATFQAAAYEAHGEEHALVCVLPVEQDEAANAVRVTVPALEEGHFLWELRAVDGSGVEERLLHGVLTALSAESALGIIDDAAAGDLREVAVQQSGGSAGELVLRWQVCSVAGAMAAAAAESAAAAAGSATAAAGSAEDAAGSAAQAHADSETTRAVYELWERKIERVVWCNPTTGTWWVYNVDTHAEYRGEDGKSPYIGESGTWWVWDSALGVYVDSGEAVRGEDGRSPYISPAGNWVLWDDESREWVDTGVRALGRDGLPGEAVKRHLVPSVAEIPTSGETCSGGHLYYVPAERVAATGYLQNLSSPPQDFGLRINGVHIVGVDPDGMDTTDVWAAQINRADCGVHASLNAQDDSRIDLVAESPGELGNLITLAVGPAAAGVYSVSGPTLEGGRGRAGEYYDVYAWFDEEGWLLVGERYDVARTDVLGLVQLGTDAVVSGGAPVGLDANMQMQVPRASYGSVGAVRPSLNTTLSSGGACGMDSYGRVWAQTCGVGRFGVGKPSYSGTAAVGCVGLMADGSYGIPWASLTAGGVTKLGSMLNVKNPIPYIIGVGATDNHELANNLLYGGALQHQKPPAWMAKGMYWLTHEHLDDTSFYLGLCTSESFTQSQQNGLELVEATSSLLGGVRLAASMTGSGVPTTALVRQYLAANYLSKDESYSCSEVNALFSELRAEMNLTYERQDHAAATYETKAAASALETRLEGELAGKMDCTESVERVVVITAYNYARLTVVDPKTLYLVTTD